ncbi:hypothetical protein [Nostoc sp. C052]|nr:hypothetical protein [Nostoc sp. C052]
MFPTLAIRDLPKLIEQNRANGRRAIRQAVREWVKIELPNQPNS